MKKIFLCVFIAVLLALSASAAGCQGENKLSVTPSEIELEQYEEAVLTVNKTGEVEWSSSDPMVVRVDENGKITSVKMGNATITASLGEETAFCEVTVVRATKNRSLIVSESELNLKIGADGQESAEVTAELKETGNTIEGITYIWTSTDANVATVKDGTIVAVGSGYSTVTVSAKYKGQSFAKEIAVTVRDWSHSAEGMAFMPDTEPTATLTAYDKDVAELGFEEGESVTAWTISGTEDGKSWDNRVMPVGALNDQGENAFERMIFDFSLSEELSGDVVFWAYDKIYTFTGGVIPALGVDYGVIIFDKATGEIFSGQMKKNYVYTAVVNLGQKSESGKRSFGIGVFQDTTIYFANVVCCNGDYYEDCYVGLNKPNEPFGAYFVYGDNLTKLENDKDGWAKQTFAEGDLWGKRVFLGTPEWTVIYNYTAMKEKFDYYGFTLMFKELSGGAIWTGGYALMFTEDGTFTKETGGEILPGDIYIYDENGNYVVGEPFKTDVEYTVKVKIQKETDGVYQNLSIGIGLNNGTFWIRDGYFIAQEVPDPIPETPEDKITLPSMVYGDAQSPLTKSTEEGYDGFYEQTFAADEVWSKRVYGYDENISFADMRGYAYYGFDVIFKNNVDSAILWNGSETTITVTEHKFNAATGDLFVYDAEGNDVTERELQLGVRYTLKIKIYGTDSNAFGLGLGGAGTIFISNPTLYK